jgi:beta-mannanase
VYPKPSHGARLSRQLEKIENKNITKKFTETQSWSKSVQTNKKKLKIKILQKNTPKPRHGARLSRL